MQTPLRLSVCETFQYYVGSFGLAYLAQATFQNIVPHRFEPRFRIICDFLVLVFGFSFGSLKINDLGLDIYFSPKSKMGWLGQTSPLHKPILSKTDLGGMITKTP